jgi:glutamate-1-semialdehyde 2,1-aminomutase
MINGLTLFPVGLWNVAAFYVNAAGKTREMRNRLLGRRIVSFCNAMGPLYVKFGQIMSTRSDVFADETIHELQRLQDDVPATSEAEVRKALAEAYGPQYETVFAEFNYQPIASASIAQVHEARLKTGERVAVKIVKNGVARRLRANLNFLSGVVGFMNALLPPIRHFNGPSRIAELRELLLPQLSMEQESRNIEKMALNFANHPFVVIPKAYTTYTRPNVLVMEFVDGISGKNFQQVNLPRPQLSRRLQDAIYTMLYMHGVAHGDPHPGNVKFTPDGKIIFLDFGITVYVTEEEKWGLASFFFASIRQEWDLATERFLTYFVIKKERVTDRGRFFEDVKKVIHRYFFEIADEWKTADFFRDISATLRQHNAEYTPNFTKVELTLASCEGFGTQIDPNIDVWANSRRFSDKYSPYMNEDVRKRFDDYFKRMTPKTLAMRGDAEKFMIASIHMNRYFFPCTYPMFAQRGEGCRIEDVDGNSYIDLTGGYGPHILGYAHPEIVAAQQKAVADSCLNAMGNRAEVELARTLVNAFPGSHYACLSNSGTEAVIHALRICRAYRKRGKVAKCEGHYHGFSDQAMVSSWFQQRGPLERPDPVAGCPGTPQSTVDNTIVLQYGHPESLKVIRERAEEIDCVILEPLPFSMGRINVDYLKDIRQLCTELDIPLVFDEVVSGFRVCYGGAQTLAGVTPDITVLGKIIGGGMPCGAVVGTKKLMEIARSTTDPFRDYETRVFLGGTMSGNSLCASSGVAMLHYLRDHPEVYQTLHENTEWLRERLIEIATRLQVPAKIKATRSIFTVSFSHRDTRFYREIQGGSDYKSSIALAYYMRTHGMYMPELHFLALSYAHTRKDLEQVCEAFELSLSEMKADGFFVN